MLGGQVSEWRVEDVRKDSEFRWEELADATSSTFDEAFEVVSALKEGINTGERLATLTQRFKGEEC